MDTTNCATASAGDCPVLIEGDHRCPRNLSSRSRSPTPPPTDSLSNLHRVTDMLKDKLNNKKDFMDTESPSHGLEHRKSPYCQQQSTSSGKNGCVPTMESPSPYPTIPPHHMSMLLGGNDMYNHGPDSATVLRGILQGKEMMDSDSEKHMRTSKRFSELYGRPDDDDVRKGAESDGESYRSASPGNMSFDDSDPDRRINGVSDMDEIVGDAKESVNGDEDSFLDGNHDNGTSDEESLDLKKSRSEMTGSSMSPSGKACNTDGLLTPPERRPKRKQYIPQQHGSLEPSPKLRKVEKEILQKQLKQMQQQLMLMQQRYCELFDQGEVPDMAGLEGSEEGRDSGSKCKNSEKSRYLSPIGSLDFDPSHFIKQASKLVQEQELLSKNSDSPSCLLSGKSPSELQNLARMLKDELSHSVSSLVDNVVAKFVEKNQKLPSPHSTPAPPLVKPKKEQTPAPVVEPDTPKPKCPTPTGALNNNNNNNDMKDMSANTNKYPPHSHSISHPSHETNGFPKPPRTKVTDKIHHSFFDFHPKPFAELARAHPALFPPPPYFPAQIPQIQPLYAKEPEQTEAMSLVLGTPNKKKRTKVTDTRLSPRAARALLQESIPISSPFEGHKHGHMLGFGDYGHPMIPMSLPTSVAIPNPSLQHSDILAMYSNNDHSSFIGESSRRGHSPSTSPNMGHTAMDNFTHSIKDMENFEQMMSDSYNFEGNHSMTTTLTPMHLRKAKLMFFYVRYPSSSILKIYFPDIKFNKNNTAQLVKWFSNFREFFYIQMEKYSRQALAEGVKNSEEMVVTTESELYRILNLHYNRNNQIDVPDTFRGVVQSTLREFFRAIQAGKDSEQSWKKAIYKVIARMDDVLPEYFKSPNWMEQLNDA